MDREDIRFLKENYLHFEDVLSNALKYYNPNIEFMPKEVKIRFKSLPFDIQPEIKHKEIIDFIITSLKENKPYDLVEHIVKAANLRRFLG